MGPIDSGGGVTLSGPADAVPSFDAMDVLGMLPSSEVPFGTVAHSGDLNMAAWPYMTTEDQGMGIGPTGAVADIWSMAPWSFE
jgi:hypothetical protein